MKRGMKNVIDKEEVGKRIFNLRMASGLSQQELSNMIKVSLTTVIRWEKGDFLPNLEYIHDLSVALGVTIEHLLRGDKDEEKQTAE